MKLTIAIPTWNRALRLEKALIDLCTEINLSSHKYNIEVFVSNNGSVDETANVIMKCGKLFTDSGILFTTRKFEVNKGFDANIISCYVNSKGDYTWFLSDDDNIISGAIDAIFKDIFEYSPSVIFYNFEQYPFNEFNPWIKDLTYLDQVSTENIFWLKKFIMFPKLSALVVKKSLDGMRIPDLKSDFGHVTLILQCCLCNMGMLYSPIFIARPDKDFIDHIDFPPYISNQLDLPILWVLKNNNKMEFYDCLAVPFVDEFISSLNMLGSFYRGRFVLTQRLKDKLWVTIRRAFRTGWFHRLTSWYALKELIKFPLSLVFFIIHYKILKKKFINLR